MAKIWLPITEPTTGRKTILYIPGASQMDKSQLNDILQAEIPTTLADLKAQGPKPKERFSRKEVGQMLRDFGDYVRSRQEDPGYKRVY